jgi:hypothetical protein
MATAETRVATDKPTPYLKQLCKHFGHKIEVSFDDERGSITFAMGRCDLDATSGDALVLRATADDDAKLADVKRIVGSHLQRFGRRDELDVAWAPPQAAEPEQPAA